MHTFRQFSASRYASRSDTPADGVRRPESTTSCPGPALGNGVPQESGVAVRRPLRRHDARSRTRPLMTEHPFSSANAIADLRNERGHRASDGGAQSVKSVVPCPTASTGRRPHQRDHQQRHTRRAQGSHRSPSAPDRDHRPEPARPGPTPPAPRQNEAAPTSPAGTTSEGAVRTMFALVVPTGFEPAPPT